MILQYYTFGESERKDTLKQSRITKDVFLTCNPWEPGQSVACRLRGRSSRLVLAAEVEEVSCSCLFHRRRLPRLLLAPEKVG